MGLAGLIVVLAWISVACFAPLLADGNQLSESYAANHHQPQMLEPSWLLSDQDKQRLEDQQGGISDKNRTDYLSITTWQYPLGTDDAGRSMWALLVYGSRISFLVAFAASFVTIALGSGLGITAGYFGGTTDAVLSRIIEAFLILPWISLAVVLASIMGRGLFNIIMVIAITSWASTSRLVRSQTLTVKTRLYVERARALGARDLRIVKGHILPNLFPIIFADLTLTIAYSVAAEALLSFLGLGDPKSVSWGSILDGAQNSGATLLGAWWYVLAPGICVTTLILGISMCGFAIEEIVNPRLRQR
jgi:peptide/nickel transport system permease protein